MQYRELTASEKRDREIAILALLLFLAVSVVFFTPAQREQTGPPPPRLNAKQQERAERWKNVFNDYFESSYRPVNKSVTQDLEGLSNQLGDGYTLTKEQVKRLQWFHDQHGATVAAVEVRQDQGRYGPYPVLHLQLDSTHKVEIKLSTDGKRITAFYGPFPIEAPIKSSR